MPGAFGTADEGALRQAAGSEPGTDGIDLVAQVTCAEPYEVSGSAGTRRIVALDFGIKTTILDHLSELGSVRVVPASTSADDILAIEHAGLGRAVLYPGSWSDWSSAGYEVATGPEPAR